MGDRTWVNIEVHEEDYEKFIEILSDPTASDHNPPMFNLEYEEVNYAGYDELNAAEKAGLRFKGSHGDGGEYGRSSFVCMDSNQLIRRGVTYVEETSNFGPVAQVMRLDDGRVVPDPKQIELIREYFDAMERFNSLDPEHKLHNKI